MKILQVIQRPQLRGAEIFACQLSEELKKKGYQIDIAYLFDNSTFDLEYELNFKAINAKAAKRFWDLKAYKKINDIIIEKGYDIVQANAGDTLKYCSFSKMLFGWKAKLVFRNANLMSGFIKNSFHLALNQLFLSQCDFFISVSENCRQDLIKIYPKSKVKSATATIGTFNFNHIKAYQHEATEEILINVGSFVPEKNHDFLLEAFSQYRKQYGSGRLWLVGDGKLRQDIQEKINYLGLSESVDVLGYRSDVISLIKAADVMVMPSLVEGLPGVILEAQSCGVPVIASTVGGIPEVIENNINGYVINQFDVREYLVKINEIVSSKELMTKMRENSKKLIHEKFMLPTVTGHFEKIYQSLLT